jgi:hypothetical protein
MYEALASAILAGIVGGALTIYGIIKSRKKMSERAAYSYNDIATKWYLWDEFVNCYYVDKLDRPIKPNPPLKSKKSKQMDLEPFQKHSTEEKIQMLIAQFGPESKSN